MPEPGSVANDVPEFVNPVSDREMMECIAALVVMQGMMLCGLLRGTKFDKKGAADDIDRATQDLRTILEPESTVAGEGT